MISSETAKNQSLRVVTRPALLFVVLLWIIKIVETQFNFSLHFLGVYPLSLEGLLGILSAPLIHGSFEHLARNSLALLILFSALSFGYPKSMLKTTIIIWLGSGLGTWLFARDAWHFGASGITHGLFFFLLLASILRKDKRSVALMMIAFFMYGGMVMSIFPRDEHISFEYHLFGAIFGALAAVMFRASDPKMPEKTYEWEGEDSADSDPIGDEWRLDKDLPTNTDFLHEQDLKSKVSPEVSPFSELSFDNENVPHNQTATDNKNIGIVPPGKD